MADKKLFFTVGADVGPGSKAFERLAKDAKRSMSDVEDALDDSESAGKQLARALETQFDHIDSAIIETKATAETLATALGPELAGKIDTTAVVQEFQRLGLSLEDIKADADSLAAALKKADDVSLKHFTGEADRARSAIGDDGGLTDSARGANSALANMIGNSAQDLGAVTGVAGSAGVAIGQMAEYASDARLAGEGLGSSLKNMAKVAGPIAVLGTGIQLVGEYMAGIEAEKAFRAGLVEDFTAAIRDAKTQSEQLLDTLKETGDLEYAQRLAKGFLSLGTETRSMLPLIEELGLSWDQVVKDIEDPGARDRIREMTAEMVFGNKETQHAATVWNDYADAVDQYGDSWRDAQGQQEIANRLIAEGDKKASIFGRTLFGVEGAASKAAQGAGKLADNTDDAARAMDNGAAAADRMRRQSERLDDQWNRLTDSMDDDAAFLSLQDQFADVKAAGEAAWIAVANKEADASAKTRDHQQAVIGLKQQVADYGRQIGMLPNQVSTLLRLADNGQIAEMERRLTILTRNRDINVTLIQRGSAGYGGLSGARAEGGPVKADEAYLVGEKGRAEVFVPDQDGYVYPTTGGGTPTNWGSAPAQNITVNMLTSDARDVVRQLRRYQRYNGRPPI